MKSRRWKWVLGVVAGLGLAFGGILWSAHRRADVVFERHGRLVAEALAAVRARPTARPPLLEPSISGNGWSSYLAALAGIEAIPDAEIDQIPTINGDPTFIPDREQLEKIFTKYSPLVDQLRQAARHETFDPSYDFESGLTMDLTNVSQAIRAARYLSDLAIFEHEEGRGGAALDTVGLGVAMAEDTGRAGVIVHQLVMIVCEGIAANTVREVLAGHSFQAAELESFARKLDRLWKARPTVADAFVAEDATVRRTLIDFGTKGPTAPMLGTIQTELPPRSWRYLFSYRLAYAGALGETEQLFQDSHRVGALEPSLRTAAMEKVSQRAMDSRNPVIRSMFPVLGKIYLRDNVAQLNWTMMRVATAIAWYEAEKGREPEKLEDLVPRYLSRVPRCPLSGLPLGYREGVVWSAGRNGVDDGGVPGKEEDIDAEDGDYVWRVTRE